MFVMPNVWGPQVAAGCFLLIGGAIGYFLVAMNSTLPGGQLLNTLLPWPTQRFIVIRFLTGTVGGLLFLCFSLLLAGCSPPTETQEQEETIFESRSSGPGIHFGEEPEAESSRRSGGMRYIKTRLMCPDCRSHGDLPCIHLGGAEYFDYDCVHCNATGFRKCSRCDGVGFIIRWANGFELPDD